MAELRTRKLSHTRGKGLFYGLIILLTFLESAAIITQAVFLARAVTYLFNGAAFRDVGMDVGFFFAAFVFRYLVSHLQTRLAEYYARQTALSLRSRLFQTYFNNPSAIRKKGTGHLTSLTMDGVDQVKTYLEIISIRMIHMLIPIVIVFYLWTLDRISAIILVVTVPIVILFMILLGKTAQDKADRQYTTYKRLSNHFIDSLKGLETLVALGKGKKHAKKINQVNTDYRKATMKTLRVAFLSSFALDFFTSISIAFVAVGLGLRLIDGEIALLPALTILILAPEYFSPVKQVGKDYHATLDGQVALSEINEVLQSGKSSRSVNEKDINLSGNKAPSLALRNLSVTMEGKTVLQNLTVEIPSGWTGIIGPSGSGKTMFINMLAGRLQPSSGGAILLEENHLETLDHRDWHTQIAYIPQNPYIFPLTLADNIRFYAPEADDDAIREIIRDIGLDELVVALPKGIHEPIGEGGRMLSGGQQQRIAIARALLSDKPAFLLDEPTAHLDIETEYDIKQVMKRVFKNKRVIMATHRLHWMNNMDHIVMLKDGKIAESGTQAQLLKKQGAYFDMIDWRKEHRL